MKRVIALFAVCFLLAAQAATNGAEEENAVKKAAKQMGSDAKKMGKQAGKAGRKVGKDIGGASSRTAKTIKQEFKEDVIEGKNDDPPPRKQKVDRHGRQ